MRCWSCCVAWRSGKRGAVRDGPGRDDSRGASGGSGLALRRRWTLVSWLPPIWTTVVAPLRSGPGEPPAGLADRRRVLRPWYWSLTTLGAVELAALVAGVPLAERRFSGTGVLLAIGGAVVLAVMVALVCWWARGQLGLPRAAAWAAYRRENP